MLSYRAARASARSVGGDNKTRLTASAQVGEWQGTIVSRHASVHCDGIRSMPRKWRACVSAIGRTKKDPQKRTFCKMVETTRLALQRAPLGDGEARKSRDTRACIVTACGACFTSEELVVSAKRKTKRSVNTDLFRNWWSMRNVNWTLEWQTIFMDTINSTLFSFYVASFIYDWQYGFLCRFTIL